MLTIVLNDSPVFPEDDEEDGYQVNKIARVLRNSEYRDLLKIHDNIVWTEERPKLSLQTTYLFFILFKDSHASENRQ